MAANPLFDCVCDELERCTRLARLSVRGAVRLALREAGLEAATVTVPQLQALLRAVLPAELQKCGVENAAALCAELGPAIAAAGAAAPAAAAAPEDLFRRIRGR